ncbi:MAG TPA: glycosyltransferase family 2 protein [Chitinophagales bacterium]|nr:glycosyltransferase family 2 protein [Chitinophagales bacterium]
METIFWISVLGLVAVYAGYGLMLAVINKLVPQKPKHKLITNDELPAVAMLIAAYNEEDIIKAKIENTLALDYPANKLKIYVVADGSLDKTVQIVSGYEKVTLLYQSQRKGKSAAITRAMQYINEPVTAFTDANVMLDKGALRTLVKHYGDKLVGGVSGEKVVMADERAAAASTEGLYWKYESFLKKQDAKLSSLTGAAGEFFSIRTRLFRPVAEDTLLDDFEITMQVIRQGYSIKYEPAALAVEKPSANIDEEYKRKVRIAAGGLQLILRNPDFLNPLIYGAFSFQYLIHRVSRWTVTPVLLVLAFITNIFLLQDGIAYDILFGTQLLFHLAALTGWYFNRRHLKIKAFHVPFYFDFMHYCVVMGWFKYLKGKQTANWQKATRLSYN